MGLSISWLAVAMKPAKQVLKELRLRDTGIPAIPGDAAAVGSTLPNGRFVVALNQFWHPMIHPESIETLSYECVVVACAEYENVNASLACLWRDGEEVWRVSHVLDEGEGHFEIEGSPPTSTESALAEARKKGKLENYDAVFSLPVRLAHEICGFRHDEPSDARFTELVQIPVLPGKEIQETILARIERLFVSFGFQKRENEYEALEFVSITDEDEAICVFFYDEYSEGGCEASLTFRVRNDRVCKLNLAAIEFAGVKTSAKDWTYERNIYSIVPDLPSPIETADDVSEWLEKTESRLPGLLRDLRSINGLDSLANDGSPRQTMFGDPTLSHFDGETGFSRLVLAYLSGNPAFDRMIAETDAGYSDGPSPSNSVHRVVEYLRKNATA
ncbi:MAG: hypothetical protein RIS44_3011 [Pseudomonadota bacterium]|jgi:hypothetical protein